MTKYAVYLYAAGTSKEISAWNTFEMLRYAVRVNERGMATLELLYEDGELDISLLRQFKDARLVIWRQPEGALNRIAFAGKVRGWKLKRVGRSLRLILRAVDYNDELLTRIVAYYAGSSQSAKSDYADDLMKAIVRENLGASAPAARNISTTGFYVEADTSLGTSLEKGMAWENVLDTLKEISQASYRTPATGITFGVVPLGKGVDREFVTRVGQWGADQRGRVMFSEANGNLINPEIEEDATNEITYVYAGGQGQGADRLVAEEDDATRIAESPLNRREAFFDGGNYETENALTAVAQGKLENGRPVLRVDFELQDTNQIIYGRDWDVGDLTTVQVFSWQYDCHVAAVEVSVQGATERILPRLEVWL